MLAKHIIKWEDSRGGHGEGGSLILWAAAVLSGDLSICSVHDEVVGVIGAKVNGIVSWDKASHVEVSVVADTEIFAATVEPGTIKK